MFSFLKLFFFYAATFFVSVGLGGLEEESLGARTKVLAFFVSTTKPVSPVKLPFLIDDLFFTLVPRSGMS